MENINLIVDVLLIISNTALIVVCLRRLKK